MVACENGTFSLDYRIDNFLMTYRSTPYATTGKTRVNLLLDHDLLTRLSLIRPSLESKVQERQSN